MRGLGLREAIVKVRGRGGGSLRGGGCYLPHVVLDVILLKLVEQHDVDVPLDEHDRERVADELAAADDAGLEALEGDLAIFEDVHDRLRRARHQVLAASLELEIVEIRYRLKAVDLLLLLDVVDDLVFVDVQGQGNLWARVQLFAISRGDMAAKSENEINRVAVSEADPE